MSRRPNSVMRRATSALISASADSAFSWKTAAPAFGGGSRDERLDFRFGGDVGLLEARAPGVLLAIANRSFAAFDIKVRNHARRTFARKLDRSRTANPARRAGDYSHFALEPVHFRFPSA